MTTYAIGDVQGCYSELMHLLDKIQFDEKQDTLWFTGDLVNRGPESLATLKFVRNLPNRIIVLGNHDLHLLAIYFGNQEIKSQDTIQDILSSPDCEELCYWLTQQPLIHHDEQHNFTLVHAGIHPDWDLKTALSLGNELSQVLNSHQRNHFFENMYGNLPSSWGAQLSGEDRLRFITNVFTRMRFLTLDKALDLEYKGTVKDAPKELIPWFKQPRQISTPIIFGHWAALRGQNFGETNVYPIDGGCVWGHHLTALRLHDQALFHFAAESS